MAEDAVIEKVQEVPTEQGYKPWGGAVEVFASKEPECIIAGPSECVHGSTVLDGERRTIKECAEKGIRPIVQTLYGPMRAHVPFRKGRKQLYKVTLSDGASIIGTSGHWMMTARGYRPVVSLQPGQDILATCQYFQERSSVVYQQVHRGDDRHSSHKDGGLRCRCSVYSRRYDEQLPRRLAVGRGDRSLPCGVCARTRGGRHWDDRDLERAYSRLCRYNSHRANAHCFREVTDRSYRGDHTAQSAPLPDGGLCRFCGRSHNRMPRVSPYNEPYDGFSSKHLHDSQLTQYPQTLGSNEHAGVLGQPVLPFRSQSSFSRTGAEFQPSWQNLNAEFPLDRMSDNRRMSGLSEYTVQWTPVQSVEPIGVDDYYDVHVPIFNHYIAHGMVHHNTGKTLACLYKLDYLCRKYEGLKTLMLRKVKVDLDESACETFEEDVLRVWNQETGEWTSDPSVRKYGGERPTKYIYNNGSEIILGGMDKSSRILSAEYDIIYVNQCEELDKDDWETLTTRATGRKGTLPWGGQLLGCANPAHPNHWILGRREKGALQFIESRHKDNPTLWDHEKEEWTEQGKKTLRQLENLTGHRKQRLRYGKWVQSSGVVYEEFDRRKHITSDPSWRYCSGMVMSGQWWTFLSVDWGYTHPAVVGWWAVDGDWRIYLYRQIYRTRMTVRELARMVNKFTGQEPIRICVADTDPEAQRVFEEEGIYCEDAIKEVETGIKTVKDRLRAQGDGKPRIQFCEGNLVMPDENLQEANRPARTEDEFNVYVWGQGDNDKPVKENDDGMDMTRYACMYLDRLEHAAPELGWVSP